jgi:hypothetical protein
MYSLKIQFMVWVGLGLPFETVVNFIECNQINHIWMLRFRQISSRENSVKNVFPAMPTMQTKDKSGSPTHVSETVAA